MWLTYNRLYRLIMNYVDKEYPEVGTLMHNQFVRALHDINPGYRVCDFETDEWYCPGAHTYDQEVAYVFNRYGCRVDYYMDAIGNEDYVLHMPDTEEEYKMNKVEAMTAWG